MLILYGDLCFVFFNTKTNVVGQQYSCLLFGLFSFTVMTYVICNLVFILFFFAIVVITSFINSLFIVIQITKASFFNKFQLII